MLLPPQDGSPLPRSQLFGPSAVVYGLCKNGESELSAVLFCLDAMRFFCFSNVETLRERIMASDEYATFKRLREDSRLYPQT